MLLKESFTTTLKPIPPFNFDGTVFVPAHFSTPDFKWKPNFYWQTLNFNELFGLKMENKGIIEKPKIKLTVYSKRKLVQWELDSLVKELNWRYGFNEDISEFCDKFKNDKFLKPILEKWRGMRINCANSLYELLMISIVLQNATIRRTVQMMNNLLNSYGTKLTFDNKELYTYWKPEDLAKIPEEELRLLKVGYRAKMIKTISEIFAKNEIDEFKLREMNLENAKNKIIELYGVGPVTAQIILGEYLRSYDNFDLKGRIWEQKILSKILFNRNFVSDKKIIKELENRYGNWKGLAFHYIFQDLFWKHRENKIDWLEKEIRL